MSFDTQVIAERKYQSEKWGEQNHSKEKWYLILAEEVGELANAILESGDVQKELIQVAAVCKTMYISGIRQDWWYYDAA